MLACALALAAARAPAQEPVLARVLSLDAAAGTMLLRVDGEAQPREIPVTADGGVPAGVAPGALVRLWPGTDGTGGEPASTARIAPLGGSRFDRDRTGVRGRLSRGSRRGPAMGGGRGGH